MANGPHNILLKMLSTISTTVNLKNIIKKLSLGISSTCPHDSPQTTPPLYYAISDNWYRVDVQSDHKEKSDKIKATNNGRRYTERRRR